MRNFTLLLLLTFCISANAAEGLHWFTDYPAAVAEATKLKRPLLLDFTGSDWCGWCIKLKKEVFNTPEFAAWAAQKVVLVEVDFPQGHSLSDAEQKQNDALAKQYNIEGFPTIMLLDASGKKQLGSLGYEAGGPAVWTAKADKILTHAQ